MAKNDKIVSDSKWLDGWVGQWGEIGLILLLFFVFAGGEPPAANESHYLSKAKHYWHPDWCRGDFFLDSADAHLVFYWTFGWLTRFFSLATTAWIGRVVIWLWLAWSWHRLCRMWSPVWGGALLAVAIAMAGWHWGHLAGEWVVGGVEAKGVAYGFVFLAMAEVAYGKWTKPWIWLGLAAMFHALVGAWSVVILALTWCTESRRHRCPLATMLPWIVGGGVLALPGLLPAITLTVGSGSECTREAAAIYVYQRLAHHLVFHRFDWPRVMAHGGIIVMWVAVWRWSRGSEQISRLNRFITFAVLIAMLGIVLDRLTWHDRYLSSAILRFYWFRMTDSLVPCGLALSLLNSFFQKGSQKVAVRHTVCILVLFLASTVCLTQVFWQRWNDPRPEAFLQGQRLSNSLGWGEHVRDWWEVCQWFRMSTPPESLVVVPVSRQTFRWYSGRGEVYSWKDIPQDVAGILEWGDRGVLLRATRLYANGRPNVNLAAVEKLADHVRFSHLVVPVGVEMTDRRFELQYRNASFVVFRLANP